MTKKQPEPSIYERLAEPFPVEVVHWRVGSTNKKNFEAGKADRRKGKPLAYLDARDVMDRFDMVCGPEGWQDEYVDVGNGATCCRIGVLIGDSWIWKSDGAGRTDFEGEKGQFSDAFKRAAVKHGPGRYLYGCDTPWIDLDEYWRIPKSSYQYLAKSLGPNAVKDRNKEVAEKNRLIAEIDKIKTAKALEAWGKKTSGQVAALHKDQSELVYREFTARMAEMVEQETGGKATVREMEKA